ncbi:uncharacterized protein LOC119769876 [Culex quinquefasciatus]|uniref:uncharacterized protein LOC119769876 n=1 Tax=Culex quinquefasciatus TaxID=7176 RepID=UPI0018E296AC|nr:uncharacterized protein LOC119769876 [Culex quinquefasciatus]
MVVTQEDKSIELLDVDPQETEDDGAVVVLDSKRKGKRTRHFRPTEQYSDIGGLDRQIQKLIEAVVLPTTHKDKFKNLRIHPPKSTYTEKKIGWPKNQTKSAKVTVKMTLKHNPRHALKKLKNIINSNRFRRDLRQAAQHRTTVSCSGVIGHVHVGRSPERDCTRFRTEM